MPVATAGGEVVIKGSTGYRIEMRRSRYLRLSLLVIMQHNRVRMVPLRMTTIKDDKKDDQDDNSIEGW